MNANMAVTHNKSRLNGQVVKGVWSGIEVGHGVDVTITGTHSRTTPGENTLLVLKTGLTEMNVQIYQSRNAYVTKQTTH